MTKVGWTHEHGLPLLRKILDDLTFVRGCGVHGDGGEAGDPLAQADVDEATRLVLAAIKKLEACWP